MPATTYEAETDNGNYLETFRVFRPKVYGFRNHQGRLVFSFIIA